MTHAAVWTGTEMIVWGGNDNASLPVNTGGRYNPSTDLWTPTSTLSAPAARSGPTAVWTGSGMIVWGGYDSNTRLGTGGRYSPSTDAWTPTSMVSAPSPRAGHIAVWTGTEMVIWGGVDIPDYLATGGRYDPSSDQWRDTSTVSAPSPRWGHTAVWSGDEILIWSGRDRDGYPSAGGRYRPATNTWTPMSTDSQPRPRVGHSAVWTGSEMIVWGGADNNQYFGDGGRYSPLADLWTPITDQGAPALRARHSAVWTGSEMLVWGGNDGQEPFRNGARYCAAMISRPPAHALRDTTGPGAGSTGQYALCDHRRGSGRGRPARPAGCDRLPTDARPGVSVSTHPDLPARRNRIGQRHDRPRRRRRQAPGALAWSAGHLLAVQGGNARGLPLPRRGLDPRLALDPHPRSGGPARAAVRGPHRDRGHGRLVRHQRPLQPLQRHRLLRERLLGRDHGFPPRPRRRELPVVDRLRSDRRQSGPPGPRLSRLHHRPLLDDDSDARRHREPRELQRLGLAGLESEPQLRRFASVFAGGSRTCQYPRLEWAGGATLRRINPNYRVGCAIVPVPWDWRREIGDAARTFLAPAIADAVSRSGGHRVWVVTHSTGALLVRSYLRQQGSGSTGAESPIEKLAMIAPANQGSPKAYYGAEGGIPRRSMTSAAAPWPNNSFISINRRRKASSIPRGTPAARGSATPRSRSPSRSPSWCATTARVPTRHSPTRIWRTNAPSITNGSSISSANGSGRPLELIPATPLLLGDAASAPRAPQCPANSFLQLLNQLDANPASSWLVPESQPGSSPKVKTALFAGCGQATVATIRVAGGTSKAGRLGLYADGEPLLHPAFTCSSGLQSNGAAHGECKTTDSLRG